MGGADSVMWSLERNWDMVSAALDGLDEETVARQPAEGCNSMAWTLWHMNRVVDMFIQSRLQGKELLWTNEGWDAKYGMEADAKVLGYSAEELADWKAPSLEVQLGYFEAVKRTAREYIQGVTKDDLDTKVIFPPQAQTREHTIATALGQMVWDNVAHGGQIAYLRGMFKGLGWHR